MLGSPSDGRFGAGCLVGLPSDAGFLPLEMPSCGGHPHAAAAHHLIFFRRVMKVILTHKFSIAEQEIDSRESSMEIIYYRHKVENPLSKSSKASRKRQPSNHSDERSASARSRAVKKTAGDK